MALNGTLRSFLQCYTCVFQFWDQLDNYFLREVPAFHLFHLFLWQSSGPGSVGTDGELGPETAGPIKMSPSQEAGRRWPLTSPLQGGTCPGGRNQTR